MCYLPQAAEVVARLQHELGINLQLVEAQDLFLERLEGVVSLF